MSGESSSTIVVTMELTAPHSETKVSTYRVNSFDRRMQSLMQRGLIAGIIPSSIAKKSSQRTLDFVSSRPGGENADIQKAGC